MKLKSGDIFATRNDGILGKLAMKLMRPYTDRFHFGLVWQKIDNDFLILESVQKGIAVGRLSFYTGQDVKFFRVNCPASLRKQAPLELTKWGRAEYDYALLFKIVVQGLWTVFKNLCKGEGIHPIRAEDLAWSHNNTFVCTEAVDIAYLMLGFSLIDGVCPTPSAFKDAELDGRIFEL